MRRVVADLYRFVQLDFNRRDRLGIVALVIDLSREPDRVAAGACSHPCPSSNQMFDRGAVLDAGVGLFPVLDALFAAARYS